MLLNLAGYTKFKYKINFDGSALETRDANSKLFKGDKSIFYRKTKKKMGRRNEKTGKSIDLPV